MKIENKLFRSFAQSHDIPKTYLIRYNGLVDREPPYFFFANDEQNSNVVETRISQGHDEKPIFEYLFANCFFVAIIIIIFTIIFLHSVLEFWPNTCCHESQIVCTSFLGICFMNSKIILVQIIIIP